MIGNGIGTTCEIIAMLEYSKRGYEINIPVGVSRYDFIAEKDGRSVRVQVKHGTPFNNGLELIGHSPKAYERREIDVLVMVDTQNDKVYFIPADHVEGMSNIRLRLEPYQKGGSKALIAEHYEKFIG